MTQTSAGAGDTPNRLFSGYDSVGSGMLSSSAVLGDHEHGGGRNALNIQVCESVGELAEALEIDGSLSVSYLKAVNVTAKMKFMKSLNVTEKSVTIVVYAAQETGTWRVTDASLKAGIEPPTDDKAAARFVRSYGDSFIKEATQGGEYYAVYTFRTATQKEQSSLTSALKAEGIYSGMTAKADVQAKISSFVSKTSVDWTLKQEMTGITGVALPGEDKLIEFALAFSSKTMNAPVTTGFAIQYYENIPGFGDGFGKVTANRRHFLGARGVLASLARLKGVEHQIRRLNDIYACYRFEDPELDALRAKVEADLETVEDQVDAWRDNPTGNFAKPVLPSLASGEPVLDFAAGQPASFGNEGGGTFDFMSVGDAFRNRVRIASIRLADGTWNDHHVIRRIEVEYASEKGRWTRIHGQDGNSREKFFLEDGQFPSLLRIHHGTYVDAIEIQLDDGRSTSAGGGGGVPTDWRPGPGAVVLGFAGRAAAAVDQIKIIHGALKKARYVKSG
ncbi:MAG: hypothetical protein E6G92_07875 [Alphaproteobacteria bacterium]|nr:MAG: hypothetical protein E6G92_07875 [Alphaproteobacteria bacterium]